MMSWPFISTVTRIVPAEQLGFAIVIIFSFLLWHMLRPRHFYFIRHGETVLNAEYIRQDDKGGLSGNGRHQADITGRFLTRFRIQRIITSPFERAKETAIIINTYLHVPIVYSALMGERRNPSEIVGKSEFDSSAAHILDLIDRSYHNDDYRFSDEENFYDLKRRARKALALLTRQSVHETCVVTHSIFLKMLIAFLLYRKNLHADDYAKLLFFNRSDNAGITICVYRPLRVLSKTHGWEVLEYNLIPC